MRNRLSIQLGAATLITTVTLLLVTTFLIVYAANYGILQEKSTANINRSAQAFQAAEAGLEFGINYLQANSSAILANPVSGYLAAYSNASVTNVSLPNGSTFSVGYTNPTANNYTLIQITSTGTSADGSVTRTVTQQVKFGSVILSPGNVPMVTKGNLSMSGNSTIANTANPQTITAGGSVGLSGNAQTVTSSGTSSTAGSIKTDISSNNSSLSGMSNSDFMATYFGTNAAAVKSQMANVYTNSSNTSYNSLNGMTGTSIWIEQTGGRASISGNTVIGSASAPVLLVVNGDFTISGNVQIYGYIFVIGQNTIDSISGNVQITGGLATTDDLNVSGNMTLSYNNSVLSALQSSSTLRYYAKVPGTWRDF